MTRSAILKPVGEHDIEIVKCSGQSKDSNDDKRLNGDDLERHKMELCSVAANFFYVDRFPAQKLHPKKFVFENRIKDKTILGAAPYMSYVGLCKIYGHLRYVAVSSKVIYANVDEDLQTIDIRHQFLGLHYFESILKFLPKKLYKQENMAKEVRPWLEAKSTFYLDKQGLIVKHVMDDKDVDQDRIQKTPVDKIKEKLAKLKKNVPTPAPAMFK